MMKHAIVAVVAALAVSAAFAAEIETDEGVLVLTDDNFDDALKAHPNLLVEFYAPWCGHCKRLAPEYAKAAGILAKQDPPMYVAKVDSTEEEEISQRFGIRGFPTLKFFAGGKPTDYDGERTSDSIVRFVKRKSGPPTKDVDSSDAVEKVKEANEVAVFGYFTDRESAEFKEFENGARGSDDVPFFTVTSADAAKALDLTDGGVALTKKFDEGLVAFDGELSAAALADFVAANELPLFIRFTPETARKLFSPTQPVTSQLLVFVSDDDEAFDGIKTAASKVAGEFKGRTLVVHINADEDRVMDFFNLSEDDLPTAVLVRMGSDGMKKFSYDGEGLTEEALSAFLTKFHAGDLKPFLKSEEVPEENDEAVKVIVGKSFADVVLDEGKDVLLEFYAPWCGHCKSLAPKYEELAERFASVDSVIIAKMDATANEIDHPGVNVQGFPTILFFPANAKDSPVSYDGERTVEAMAKYVEENASVKFTLADEADEEDSKDEL